VQQAALGLLEALAEHLAATLSQHLGAQFPYFTGTLLVQKYEY
jgi:hypothetical protein